jgi:phospholipase C
VLTVSPVHRFYQNRMQINGGKNDMFVAWTKRWFAGHAGHYNPEDTISTSWRRSLRSPTSSSWPPLAVNLNHFWLACACTPIHKNAPTALRAELDAAGNLKLARSPSPPSTAADLEQ